MGNAEGEDEVDEIRIKDVEDGCDSRRGWSQETQPPLTLARGLAYRGRVVDASP